MSMQADLIIKGNAIFTGSGCEPRKGAVAVKDDRIIAVVGDGESTGLEEVGARVVDVGDCLVMPGFNDAHVHLLLGSLYDKYVNLHAARSEEEAAKMVFEYAAENPDEPWIFGFSWYNIFWDNPKPPSKDSLDRLIPDRPVFLLNAEGHGIWVNSKALEICGIDRNTPDPAYGRIGRNVDGEPDGQFFERAVSLVATTAVKGLSSAAHKALVRGFLQKAARLGVTSVSDSLAFPGFEVGGYELYRELEEAGELTTRIHFLPALTEKLDTTKALREKYNSLQLRFSGLKQFVDGVATIYTARLIEPYSDDPSTTGQQPVSADMMENLVQIAQREGFRVRLHACGDGAVRLCLDCIEKAQHLYGHKGLRHSIEHIENIHPSDLPRFKQLGVIASMQPEHITITDDFASNPYPVRLGPERTRLTWALKSLQTAGAKLAFGSDYPVVDLQPMLGVYRAVTRLHNDGQPKGGWIPQEKISLAEVLSGYTAGSAYTEYMENELGTLEAGKLADIVVLDRNLFAVDPGLIRQTKVRLTVAGGKVIYED
jgi:predicted amidohydrolase YtcJ